MYAPNEKHERKRGIYFRQNQQRRRTEDCAAWPEASILRFKMRLLATLLLALYPAVMAAGEPFFFVQLADPQFGMYTENHDFRQETANFEFAIATANRLRPAFVIVCGDLLNKPGDPEQSAEYLRIAKELDPSIPLYSVAGNHDIGNEPTPESLSAYRNRFGRDYYTFRSGDMEGIVLDSGVIQVPEKVQDELAKQEAWLRDQLAKAKQEGVRHIVVFQHHPWFLSDPEEPDQYFSIPLVRRRKYLALFKEYGVRYIFAGHYHRNAEGHAGDIYMVTSGPVGKPLGKDGSGLRIVTVRDSGLEHHYYDFGFVPNMIDLAVRPAAAQ